MKASKQLDVTMSATVLFELKKKRRAPNTKKSPFPLVFNLGCDEKSSIVTWQFYRGTLRPDGVEVTAKEDTKNLYHMGYFGKGSLSRSAPRFKAAAADVGDAPEMSHRRYERHKQMQEDAKETRGSATSPRFVLLSCDESSDEGTGAPECTVVTQAEDEPSTSQARRHRKSDSDPDIVQVFSKTALESEQERGDAGAQEDPALQGTDEEDAAGPVARTPPCAAQVEVGAASDDDVTEVPSDAALDTRKDGGILEIDLDGNDQEPTRNDDETNRRPKEGFTDDLESLYRVCKANDVEVITSYNGSRLQQERKVRPAQDPWPIDESLELFFEEAYFLSYGLGCLIVRENNEELDLLMLWQRLCTLCPAFPARYATYHHFRSKGWVVRAGSKYAADYLLYKDGPPFYHATFSVLVRQAWSETLQEHEDRRLRTWASMAGLIRLNATSAKAVLLCYVVIPKDADLSTPECLRSFKIQELLLRRWITSEERERKDDG